MLTVTTFVIFVTSARCHAILATNGGKVFDGGFQIPVRKVIPWQEDMSQEVKGSNPGPGMMYCGICTFYNVLNVWINSRYYSHQWL